MHVRAGFRAVLRQPALALGEIAWRWAFGAAAWILAILAVRRILAQVDITQVEMLIARHSDLFLIADACARILIQVLQQLARECLVLVPAIAMLWIAAATLGRAVTLHALAPEGHAARWSALTTLHCLRALFTLATLIAWFGSLFLAGLAMPARNPATAAIMGVLLAALVGFFWSVVNWFLALAPIWIVRDGQTAWKSISDSLGLYRRSPGPYAGIAVWFGLFRGLAFVGMFVAALLGAQASPAAAIALWVVIALIYFAVADSLYIARLAAFVALDESGQPSAISSQPAPRWFCEGARPE
ncbi:MAG: hypothetical protein LAO06_14345 [Acidobacteriia bacterium]|nr:hypothetical protein [Terriglobia bacterium]